MDDEPHCLPVSREIEKGTGFGEDDVDVSLKTLSSFCKRGDTTTVALLEVVHWEEINVQ